MILGRWCLKGRNGENAVDLESEGLWLFYLIKFPAVPLLIPIFVLPKTLICGRDGAGSTSWRVNGWI